MSEDCSWARFRMRWPTRPMSAWASAPPRSTPRSTEAPTRRIESAAAISVLEGTTSVRTAAPPNPWRSTRVTRAPSFAATMAAS